ncbi:unnamed protein product, partial [Allacma fusca]
MRVVVKTEPEEPTKATFPSGPWVVLKRLRPEEIPSQRQDDFEDNSSYICSEDNNSDHFPAIDFDLNGTEEEEDLEIDAYYQESSRSPKRRRVSCRNKTKSVGKSFQTTEICPTTTAKIRGTKRKKNVKNRACKTATLETTDNPVQ